MNKLINLAFALMVAISVRSQTSMLNEFKACPAFPTDAKNCFKVAKMEFFNNYYSYKDCSDPIKQYSDKLLKDNKPYVDIETEKSNKTTTPATGAASDFSDLNSPEMQAKIAKMSDAEKMQFALEMQKRLSANKNVQQIHQINKPSPLNAWTMKIHKSGDELVKALTPFQALPFPVYSKCDGLCSEADPTCAKKVEACESKISHDFYNSEVARYATYMKGIIASYNAKKITFENDLKEFDKEAAKYSKEDIAADYMAAFIYLGAVTEAIKNYEAEGARVIMRAKNDAYCAKDF